MAGSSQTEKVDSSCLTLLLSHLKINRRRHCASPDAPGDKTDNSQKSDIEPPNPTNVFDAPKPPAIIVNGDLSRNTTSLKSTGVRDLWQEAFEQLDDRAKDILGKEFEPSGGAITLIDTVRARESEFKSDSARLKIGDDEILWRDCAARVIGWLTSFGDIVVGFAPSPASVIWSGLKILLQAEVDRCEYLVAILKCAETVLPLVRRGAIYEKVYLRGAPEELPQSTRLLREALCNAYVEALKLMVSTKSALNENAVQRFLQALLHPGEGAGLMQGLNKAESRIGLDVQACEADQRKGEDEKFGELLRSLETPLRHTQVSLDSVLDTLSKNERSRMLETFSHVQVGDQHRRKKEMRIEGSGEWLPKHSKFKTWENSNSSSILWLTGQVGAGKTILASTVIDRYWIKDVSDTHAAKEGFAYFYYSKNDPGLSNGDPTAQILGSFLRQLATIPGYPKKTFKTLLKLRDDMENKMMTSDVQGFEKALSELSGFFPRTFIFLDGLDEIERPADADKIIKILVELAQKSERPIKIFISSRDEVHLRRSFEYADRIYERISVVDENHPDINGYIRIRVQKVGRDWPEGVKQKVESTLCDQARGMFRWAYLHIEQLATINSPKEVLARLNNLPQGLEATYDELYKKNEGDDETCLQRAVKWVMYTCRPLHTKELLSAVQLGTNDDRSQLEIDIRLSESSLERVCHHLIVKDTKGYWSFPHASVKEYFRDKHRAWSLERALVELAELSLLLLIKGFRDIQPPQDWENAQRMMKPIHNDGSTPDPVMILRTYVTIFWLDHFESIQHENVERKSIMELFRRFILAESDPSCSSLQYRTWGRCFTLIKRARDARRYSSRPRRDGDNELWYSKSRSSMYRYASDILPANTGKEVVLFSPRNVPIKWAEECLKQNIGSNIHGNDLLLLAAKYGRVDMLEKLIEMGMDVNRVSVWGRTALVEAIEHKEKACVKFLLENGAEVNAETDMGIITHTLDHWDEEFEKEILELLLKYGANVDALSSSDCGWGSALEKAASWGKVVGIPRCKWLIEAGATVNLQTHSGCDSAIVTAVFHGRRESVDFLRSHGADVHVHTRRFGSVLAAAFCGSSPDVMVPYLLEAKVEAKTLVSDLSTKNFYFYQGDKTKRAEAAKYLLSYKHVTIADLRKLELAIKRKNIGPTFPTNFLASLEKERDERT
ncbi:hypothetical protein G7054_g5122 [Neopestalotiopsis clavispora]|nr:hypothetical protein G7054_g5122 [Neopestalotiopsis clavispora]